MIFRVMSSSHEHDELIVKPQITLLQAEENMINDLRDYVRAEKCSVQDQMKLHSFAHDNWRERMARLTMLPTLHWFFPRKGEEYKDTTENVQIIQVCLHIGKNMFIYSLMVISLPSLWSVRDVQPCTASSWVLYVHHMSSWG